MYILNGVSTKRLQEFHSFDLINNKWEEIEMKGDELPIASNFQSSCVVDDIMYYFLFIFIGMFMEE
jgi:hypothetical protein